MTKYRHYRGIDGEPVRVPVDTIAAPLRVHPRTPFPFATIAGRASEVRDRVASAAGRAGFYCDPDAMKKFFGRLVTREALAGI